jgi:shikimate dehydrogenase
MSAVSGSTKILGVIGWPVSHSLSPCMQNAALAALGLDYAYLPFPVAPADLGTAIRGLRALGVAGFNVTIPHKEAVIPFLDVLSPEAEAIGAVNTVNREGERFVGYNTDGIGLMTSLREDLGLEARGASVLLLGAGGAARGAVAALCAAGVAGITIANRTVEKGEEIAERFRDRYPSVAFSTAPLAAVALKQPLQHADLLLNTTSVGMHATTFGELELDLLKPTASVYDMVYIPGVTPLLTAAGARGHRTANGLGMLAAQGEAAYAIWTGVRPPQGLMKGCLTAATAQKMGV